MVAIPPPSLRANFFRNVWIAYAFALLVAQALSMGLVAKSASLSWLHWVGAVLQAWFVLGSLGYALNRPIGSAATWTAAFWVACFCYVLGTISLARTVGWPGAAFLLYWLIAQLPMLYALWAYQIPNHPRWRSLEAYRNHCLMEQIDLSESIRRTIVHQDSSGVTTTETVSLSLDRDIYVVKLDFERNGNLTTTRNDFWSLEAAVGFVERESHVRLADLLPIAHEPNSEAN